MRNRWYAIPLLGGLLLLCLGVSCSVEKNSAESYLAEAKESIGAGDLERAAAYLDSIALLFPTDLEARREAQLLRDSVRWQERELLRTTLQTKYKELTQAIAQLTLDFTLTPEGSTEALETGRHYRHRAMPTPPTAPGLTLITSTSPEGWFEVTHYYIGTKRLYGSALTLILSDGTRSSATPLSEDGAHYAHFASGGLHHETLQLPPHAAKEIGALLYRADSLQITPQVELLQNGMVVASYPLPKGTQEAHFKTARLAHLLQEREAIRTRGERNQALLKQRP